MGIFVGHQDTFSFLMELLVEIELFDFIGFLIGYLHALS